MAHHFLHAPAHCSTEEAIRWGQITALGGTQQLAACVATQLGEHFRNDAFWLSVIRWFIAHPTFDPGQVGPAVDFIRHVKFERTRIRGADGEYEFPPPPQPGFSMTGRTPDALLRQMERWHATLHRNSTAAETWPTCGIRGLRRKTPIRGIGAGWTIEELLSAGNLEREGCEMRHCVSNYAVRCAAGHCSIWRVRGAVGDVVTERWTVEVTQGGVIVQVRGKCNEPARGEVIEVLRRWSAREKLSLAVGF